MISHDISHAVCPICAENMLGPEDFFVPCLQRYDCRNSAGNILRVSSIITVHNFSCGFDMKRNE